MHESCNGESAIVSDAAATSSCDITTAEDQECPQTDPSRPDFFQEDYSPDGTILPSPSPTVPQRTGVPDVPGTNAEHSALPIGPMPSWRPGPSPALGAVPTPGTVISLTEKAAIRKMHSLGKSLPDYSMPPHLEHVD